MYFSICNIRKRTDGEGTRDGARKQGPITRNSFWSNYWNWGQFTNVKILMNLWTPLIIKYSYIIAISMRFLCTIWPRQSNYCQVNRARLVAKDFAAGCACPIKIDRWLARLTSNDPPGTDTTIIQITYLNLVVMFALLRQRRAWSKSAANLQHGCELCGSDRHTDVSPKRDKKGWNRVRRGQLYSGYVGKNI